MMSEDAMNADADRQPVVNFVELEFAFLIEMGFRVDIANSHSVLYENDNGVFVRIFNDPRERYVGFRVGLASRPRDALNTTELARLAGPPVPRGEYPERTDQLHASVARIAHQLRSQGERPL